MKRLLPVIIFAILFVDFAYAQTPLRQSTSRVVQVCGVVAVGDGFTPVTTLTLGTADEAEAIRANTATLDISAATFAAVTGADGCYALTLDATATSTVGDLTVLIQDDSLVLPMREKFTVVEEAVYDNIYAAAAVGPITSATLNARTLASASYFDPAADPVANVTLVATTTTNTDMRGTDGVDTAAMRGTNSAALASSFTFTVAGQVDANVESWNAAAITTALETSTDYVDAWNASACASPVAGTLEFQLCTDLDLVLAQSIAGGVGPWTTGGGGSAPTVVQIRQEMDSNSTQFQEIVADTNEMQSDDYPARFTGIEGAGFVTGTHSLAAIRARGDVAWLTGAGGSSPTVVQIRQEMDANSSRLANIVADTNELQTDNVPSLIAALNDPSSTEISNAILAATVDGSINVQCALALAIAYGSGAWAETGGVVTYRNPSNAANRIVGTIAASSFGTVTVTCP